MICVSVNEDIKDIISKDKNMMRKPKKKTKNDKDLILDHGPQHGVVRCSTH